MNRVSEEKSVRALLRSGIAELRDAHVPSYTLAAELLLLHVLGRDRTWMYSHPEEEISRVPAERYSALIRRRAEGEPTQHLTGKQEFWGLEFEVTPDVLIPRPETEHVIEVALDRLAAREIRAGRRQPFSPSGEPLHRETRELSYRRVYELDPSIDANKISAGIEQGILTVNLPKAENLKPRRITLE